MTNTEQARIPRILRQTDAERLAGRILDRDISVMRADAVDAGDAARIRLCTRAMFGGWGGVERDECAKIIQKTRSSKA